MRVAKDEDSVGPRPSGGSRPGKARRRAHRRSTAMSSSFRAGRSGRNNRRFVEETIPSVWAVLFLYVVDSVFYSRLGNAGRSVILFRVLSPARSRSDNPKDCAKDWENDVPDESVFPDISVLQRNNPSPKDEEYCRDREHEKEKNPQDDPSEDGENLHENPEYCIDIHRQVGV